jgi:aspartyl-tRNA(Asn)/glutamyl-tRNA(Gln) amidotransferase subunit B
MLTFREKGAKEFGTKVEIKNLNSFKFVEKAIDYEITRQIETIRSGEKIIQETRLWDETKGLTRSMRSKEQAADYRYFPDPDLLPVIIDEFWIARIRETLPELPAKVRDRFFSTYKLEPDTCDVLSEEKLVADYFDRAVEAHNSPQLLANWLTTELFGRLNKDGVKMTNCPISPENLGELVKLIDENVISGKIAKTVFDEMFTTGADPKSIVENKGLKQISDVSQIEKVIDQILEANADQVAAYRSGKDKLFGFFVGQVMKETQGKANPGTVNDLLNKKLKG